MNLSETVETTTCPSCKQAIFVPDYLRKGDPLRCLGCGTSFFYESDLDDHGLRAPRAPDTSLRPRKPAVSLGGPGPRPVAQNGRQEALEGHLPPEAPVTPPSEPEATVAKVGDTSSVAMKAGAQVYGPPWKRFLGEINADVLRLGVDPAAEQWAGRGLSRHVFNMLTHTRTLAVPRRRSKRRAGKVRQIAPPKKDQPVAGNKVLSQLVALVKMNAEDLGEAPSLNAVRFIEILAHALAGVIALDQQNGG